MGSQKYVVTTLQDQYVHFASLVNMNERSHDMQGGGEQVVCSTVQQCTLHTALHSCINFHYSVLYDGL